MMILFELGNKSIIVNFERTIYKFFFYLPLAFIPLLLIPFFGIGISLIFYVSLIGDKSMVLYSDQKIRIEQQYIRFMGPDPQLDIYVKDRFFSYQDTTVPFTFNEMTDTLSVLKLDDSTYLLGHSSPKNWEVPTGYEEFRYSIDNK
jgi:hypothetical protein